MTSVPSARRPRCPEAEGDHLLQSALAVLVVGCLVLGGSAASAANLKNGQVIVTDSTPILGQTPTHVNLETGEQQPMFILGQVGGAVALANGKILNWAASSYGSAGPLILVDPDSGAHHQIDIEGDSLTDVVEDRDGNYLLALDGSVARLDANTEILEVIASSGITAPRGLAADSNGDIFIAESDKILLLESGQPPVQVFAEGEPLDTPTAIDFAPNGDLLVAGDLSVVRIDRETASQALVASYAELPGSSLLGNGGLRDLVVDGDGDVYVAQARPLCDGQFLSYAIRRLPSGGGIPVEILCGNTTDFVAYLSTLSVAPNGRDLILLAGRFAGASVGSVIRLEPDTGGMEVLSQSFPVDHVAFSHSGELYGTVLDSILQVDPRTGFELREVASGGFISSPRGLLVSDDESYLFVLEQSDIVRVNIATGAQARVFDVPSFILSSRSRLRRSRDGRLIVPANDPYYVDQLSFQSEDLLVDSFSTVLDVADPGSGDVFVLGGLPYGIVGIDPATGDERPIGSMEDLIGFGTPLSMVATTGGQLLVTVVGGGVRGLFRVDPSDGSSFQVSDLPLAFGTTLTTVVAPEASPHGAAILAASILTALRAMKNPAGSRRRRS